jgi:acylphosphatase
VSEDLKAVRWTLSGRVQGVGFRYFAYHEALRLGVVGTVRNLYSGDVEVYAEGPEDVLLLFRSRLEKGPSFGCVTGIEEEWATATGKHKEFQITH